MHKKRKKCEKRKILKGKKFEIHIDDYIKGIAIWGLIKAFTSVAVYCFILDYIEGNIPLTIVSTLVNIDVFVTAFYFVMSFILLFFVYEGTE